MSAKTDKLLSLYRTYENLVRDAGEDPKGLEASMEGVLSSEMTMIRQFRNFLAHTEAPGFLEPTDRMLAVLEAQVKDWSMRGDVARKHARTPAAAMCADTDTCADAVAKLVKLKRTKIACACRDGGYVAYGIHDLVAAALENKRSKVGSVKPLREKVMFVAPQAPAVSVDRDAVTVCTADGTPSGKPVGAVLL